MKLTIIRQDRRVYKDGVSYGNLNLDSIPTNIHALQFNDTSNTGWLEFSETEDGEKPANEKITSLPTWANDAVLKWDEAKAAELLAIEIALAQKAAAEAKQPVTTGTLDA